MVGCRRICGPSRRAAAAINHGPRDPKNASRRATKPAEAIPAGLGVVRTVMSLRRWLRCGSCLHFIVEPAGCRMVRLHRFNSEGLIEAMRQAEADVVGPVRRAVSGGVRPHLAGLLRSVQAVAWRWQSMTRHISSSVNPSYCSCPWFVT